MHILPVKNLFVVCSLLNDWNYFWNKYCNLPFLAICRSQLPLLIFLAPSWYQKAKIGLRMSLRNKKKLGSEWACEINKWLIIILKQPVIKQSPTFLRVFFHWLLHKCFFSFLISASANFEKFIRFHRQTSIVYKNGENWKYW